MVMVVILGRPGTIGKYQKQCRTAGGANWEVPAEKATLHVNRQLPVQWDGNVDHCRMLTATSHFFMI
jgi:hypothetical protein